MREMAQAFALLPEGMTGTVAGLFDATLEPRSRRAGLAARAVPGPGAADGVVHAMDSARGGSCSTTRPSTTSMRTRRRCSSTWPAGCRSCAPTSPCGWNRRRRRLRHRGRPEEPAGDRRGVRSLRDPERRAGWARTAAGPSRSGTTGRRSSQARRAVPEGRVTLLVEAPPAYEPERRYVLDVVLGDWLGLDWRARGARSLRRPHRPRRRARRRSVVLPDVLFATPREDWLTAASLPGRARVDGLPVLYGVAGGQAAVDVDVFGSASSCSRATRSGCWPIATTTAASLPRRRSPTAPVPRTSDRRRLRRPALGSPAARLAAARRRRARTRSPSPTTSTTRSPCSTTAAARRHAPARRRPPAAARSAGWRARRARSLRGRPRLDPHNTFDFLMDVSERHGLRSAFYFLAHRDRVPRDDRLPVRASVGALADRAGPRRGHEVGLHPSFSTYRDAGRTREEFERLLRVAEAEGVRQDEWGGRQHFLRWANPEPGATGRRPGSTTTARSGTPTRSASGPGRATPTASSTCASDGRSPAREAVPGHGRGAAASASALRPTPRTPS